MSKIVDEFPECPHVHADWEFTLIDKKTREIKNRKKFRILAIQNTIQKVQHVVVIIQDLGDEYVQLPELVEKFLSQVQETKFTYTSKGDLDSSNLKFSRNVYIYTNKLLVSEDAIRKRFEKNNLVLQARIIK